MQNLFKGNVENVDSYSWHVISQTCKVRGSGVTGGQGPECPPLPETFHREILATNRENEVRKKGQKMGNVGENEEKC